MSSQEVSMEQGFVNQYDGGDMVEFTRKRTPPTLWCWDRSTLPMWQTFTSVLQDPNNVYIGPKKYAPNKWTCERLSYLLYKRRITPADYRRLYEEYAREKLWDDLDELEGKKLLFFQKDLNKSNGPILVKLCIEKFGDNPCSI